MNLAQIFANNVKIYRVMAGLTQKDLAKLLGIHQSKICRLEREEISVSFGLVEKLAEVLKVEPFELFRNHVLS